MRARAGAEAYRGRGLHTGKQEGLQGEPQGMQAMGQSKAKGAGRAGRIWWQNGKIACRREWASLYKIGVMEWGVLGGGKSGRGQSKMGGAV
jgi:hypothetical protein